MLDDRRKDIILAMAECNMNVSEVAQMKHYHRNSIIYHCNHIHQKTGLNPHNFYDLVKLVDMVKGDSNG